MHFSRKFIFFLIYFPSLHRLIFFTYTTKIQKRTGKKRFAKEDIFLLCMENQPTTYSGSRTISEEEQLIQIHWKLLLFLNKMVKRGVKSWYYMRKERVGLKKALRYNDLKINCSLLHDLFTEQMNFIRKIIEIGIAWNINEGSLWIPIWLSVDCNFIILIMFVGNIFFHRRASYGIFKGVSNSLSKLLPFLKLLFTYSFHLWIFFNQYRILSVSSDK